MWPWLDVTVGGDTQLQQLQFDMDGTHRTAKSQKPRGLEESVQAPWMPTSHTLLEPTSSAIDDWNLDWVAMARQVDALTAPIEDQLQDGIFAPGRKRYQEALTPINVQSAVEDGGISPGQFYGQVCRPKNPSADSPSHGSLELNLKSQVSSGAVPTDPRQHKPIRNTPGSHSEPSKKSESESIKTVDKRTHCAKQPGAILQRKIIPQEDPDLEVSKNLFLAAHKARSNGNSPPPTGLVFSSGNIRKPRYPKKLELDPLFETQDTLYAQKLAKRYRLRMPEIKCITLWDQCKVIQRDFVDPSPTRCKAERIRRDGPHGGRRGPRPKRRVRPDGSLDPEWVKRRSMKKEKPQEEVYGEPYIDPDKYFKYKKMFGRAPLTPIPKRIREFLYDQQPADKPRS